MTPSQMVKGGAMALFIAVTGCAPEPPERRQSSQNAQIAKSGDGAVRSSKKIGDPCVPSDGWQLDPGLVASSTPLQAIQDGAPPGFGSIVPFHNVPPGAILLPTQTPAGTALCDTDPIYPDGYWTVHCLSQTDCPPLSGCGGSFCRKVCVSVAECANPRAGGNPACSGSPPICSYSGGFGAF